MKNQPYFKELTTFVPEWANWSTVDENGEIWVWKYRPEESLPVKGLYGVWDFTRTDGLNEGLQIGQGPAPKDWRKEIYRLVADE